MYSFYDVACVVGYTGDICDNKCTFPSYGHACQTPCACQQEDCNFIIDCGRSLDGILQQWCNSLNMYMT